MVTVHDLHAKVLPLFSIAHTKRTYRFQGSDFRLTDVNGKVVKDILQEPLGRKEPPRSHAVLEREPQDQVDFASMAVIDLVGLVEHWVPGDQVVAGDSGSNRTHASNSQDGGGLARVGWNRRAFVRAVERQLRGDQGGWERGPGGGLHCSGSGVLSGLARRTPAAGFQRSPPLAGWLARCVMTARSQPPGDRPVADAFLTGSRAGRSSCGSRTTP